MARLMVITTPDLAPGFQLAGVETYAVDTAPEAEKVLAKLMSGDEASLIVVRRKLLEAMSARLRQQVKISNQPIVLDIPGSMPAPSLGERRRQIAGLLRQAIGFQITFGRDQSSATGQ